MSERYVKAGPWCTQKQLSELPMGLQDEVMARVRSQQDGTPATEAAATSNEPFKVTDMSFLYNTTNDNYGDKFAGKFKPQRTKMSNNDHIAPPETNLNEQRKTAQELEQYTAAWKQGTKKEHPMYLTSANVIGAKKPTRATEHQTTFKLQASFSKEFTSRYENNGLNTSMDPKGNI